MRIRFFYEAGDQNTAGHTNLLKNFIKELAYREIEVECVELDAIGGEVNIVNFSRSVNTLTIQSYNSQRTGGMGEATISILDASLDVKVLKQIGRNKSIKDGESTFIFEGHSNPQLNVLKLKSINLDMYDGIIGTSDSLHKLYADYFPSSRIFVMKETINHRLFYVRPTAEIKWDLVFIAPGNLDEEVRDYLNAYDNSGKLSIAVVGETISSELIQELENRGTKYFANLADEQTAKLISEARAVAVLTSGSEGVIPSYLLEALALGVPVMSNFIPSANSDLVAGKHYLSFNTAEEFANCRRIMEGDRAQTRERISNGLRAINRRFTSWHRVNDFLNYYESLNLGYKPLKTSIK